MIVVSFSLGICIIATERFQPLAFVGIIGAQMLWFYMSIDSSMCFSPHKIKKIFRAEDFESQSYVSYLRAVQKRRVM